MDRQSRLHGARSHGGPQPRSVSRGFTLVELMVAIFVMALLALLSWRGLDGMARAQAFTQTRADEVLTVQATLAQWSADLDAAEQALPRLKAIEWDGRGLRIVRRSSASSGAGWLVVGWTRRDGAQGSQWLRWQSPELWRQGDLLQAWEQAGQWMQNASPELRAREVVLLPLADWQLYYFRGDAWTNPLSSADRAAQPQPPLPGQPGQPSTPAVPAATPARDSSDIPDGVRLVLTLPAGHALAGVLQRDWVNPTVSVGRSS